MSEISRFLREQAMLFRDIARRDNDPNIRRQLAALARQCEDIALGIEEGPSYRGGAARRHAPSGRR